MSSWLLTERSFELDTNGESGWSTSIEIARALDGIDVDLDKVRADVGSRRPHEVIGESYQEFERYEAFGVPTFVVNGDATFVRYMTGPTDNPNDSIKIIESLISMMAHEPDLNEFKHTRLPL